MQFDEFGRVAGYIRRGALPNSPDASTGPSDSRAASLVGAIAAFSTPGSERRRAAAAAEFAAADTGADVLEFLADANKLCTGVQTWGVIWNPAALRVGCRV